MESKLKDHMTTHIGENDHFETISGIATATSPEPMTASLSNHNTKSGLSVSQEAIDITKMTFRIQNNSQKKKV